MLDFADAVAINKFERRGARPTRCATSRRQLARNREWFGRGPEEMPVFGTIASRFNDDGVTALYQYLAAVWLSTGLAAGAPAPAPRADEPHVESGQRSWCPPSGCGTWPRSRRRCAATTPAPPSRRPSPAGPAARRAVAAELGRRARAGRAEVGQLVAEAAEALGRRAPRLLEGWPATVDAYPARTVVPAGSRPRDPTARRCRAPRSPRWRCPAPTTRASSSAGCGRTSRAGSPSPPGCSPSSAQGEDPARCSPARATPSAPTAASTAVGGQPAKRLSTAFDSVTLYGYDPDQRPTSTARSATAACRSPPSTT